jgi:hypothetical protein
VPALSSSCPARQLRPVGVPEFASATACGPSSPPPSSPLPPQPDSAVIAKASSIGASRMAGRRIPSRGPRAHRGVVLDDMDMPFLPAGRRPATGAA